MTAISPPPSLSPAVLPSTSQTATLATVPDPPAAVAGVPVGTIITGTVVGRDARGLVAIRTDNGTLALVSHANLPTGSTVALEVRVAGARMQLIVLSVNPPPGSARAAAPGAAAPTAAGGASAPPSAPAGNAAPAPVPLSVGGLVTAAVTQPAPAKLGPARRRDGAATDRPSTGPRVSGQATDPGRPAFGRPPPAGAAPSPPAGAGPVQPGRPPFGPQPPGGGQSPGAVPSGLPASNPGISAMAPPGPAPANTPAAGPPISATIALAASPAPPGSGIVLRVLALLPPGAAGAPAAPAAPAFTGTVVSLTAAGHPIVVGPLGTLVLFAKTDLPVGGVIVLEVAAPPPAAGASSDSLASATTAAAPQRSLLALSQGWPALTEAAEVLERTGPEARAELAHLLPQAGPRLAAGLAAMLAALAAGDADRWLAPALRQALERAGRADLANRLRGEFHQAARLAADPIGGDWRVAYLPLHDGAELRQINLYLRGRRRPGGADAESESPTRFILELELSRLGPLQLDGLVNRHRFDLMLRSRAPLSASMRRDIEAIFAEARAACGFAGAIAFQAAETFPVVPLDEAAGKSAGVVV